MLLKYLIVGYLYVGVWVLTQCLVWIFWCSFKKNSIF